ncbi:MAG: hypothetical protein ACHRHE_07255 [Tepidisphaerales bacterium]
MKHSKKLILNALTILSLVLGVATTAMWVSSFRADSCFLSFNTATARYTLKSTWGQLVLAGPRTDGPDDPVAAEIASRMSNDDFDWQPPSPAGRWEGRLEGNARQGSATWEMYQRFQDKIREGKGLEAAERLCLKAVDDPHRFVPAHMMLLLMEKRWREAYAWEGIPLVRIFPDSSGSRPDLSHWMQLRDQWHAARDVPRISVFDGWLVLCALIAPLAWAARPRHEPRSRGRWAFNGLALVSAMLCAAMAALWIRSYWVSEEWAFWPRPSEDVPSMPKMDGTWSAYRYVSSSRGRLTLLDRKIFGSAFGSRSPIAGYERRAISGTWPLGFGVVSKDERNLSIPGIEFHSRPPFEALVKLPPTLLPQGLPPGSATQARFPGFRSLIISWWIPVLASSILPAFWARRQWICLREQRLLLRQGLCRICGYDLRATPERCPECGTAVGAEEPA